MIKLNRPLQAVRYPRRKMTRCSEKTAKGLRCKSHGVEHDGKVICATHLKHMMPGLIPLIPSAATAAPAPPPCTHTETCDLTHEKCCECSDERPIQEEGYVAYINPHLADAVLVPRHYYYCPSCKKQLANSEPPKFDWAKIDVDAEAKMADEDEKEQRGINLCESGMGDLVYHLGFCSDVIGDCWIEHYYSGGVSALKKQLRKSSEYVHKHGNCKECKRLINGIHH